LEDESDSVRETTFDLIDYQSQKTQLKIYEDSIAATHNDVKYATLVELEGMSDHDAFEVLITGLADPDADFRAEVSQTIMFLVDMEFESYEQAAEWWETNKEKMDDNLFPIEE
jgi:hypothetical protein